MGGALRANEQPVALAHGRRPRIFERLRAARRGHGAGKSPALRNPTRAGPFPAPCPGRAPLADSEERTNERGRAGARALDFGEVGKHALVGGGIDVREALAAAGPHQEEEVQHLGAELLRQLDHRGHLAHVPVRHRHVEREIEVGVGQHASGPHRGLPGARQVAERIVLDAIGGVEADRGAEDAVRAHQRRFALAQQHAVGAEHGREPLLGGIGHDVPDVPPEQGLAPGEDQEDVRVDLGDLVHHPPALVGGQLASRVGAGERRHVAVRAFQIAPLREIPRHAVRRVRVRIRG